uniref:Uncharacterized protein n=1 Tax=Biomphalaria glabrata TaxID=6526 RepID=A0A2C9K7Q8_BIOGL
MAKTLASIFRQRGQSTLLRIDHSDVYFENEKLDQDLNFDIDILQREQFRQKLVRDAEIREIKKSFGLQQRSASSGNLVRTMERKVSSHQLLERQSSSNQLNHSLTSTSVKQMKRPTSVVSDSTSDSVSSSEVNLRPDSKRPVSLLMPKTKSFLDVSDTNSSRNTSESQDSDSERDVLDLSARTIPKVPRLIPRSAPVGKKAKIEAMMRTLKLDKIPAHWYTTVVPAVDVTVNYNLAKKDKSKDARPHTTTGVRSNGSLSSAVRSTYNRSLTKSARNKEPSPPPVPEVSTAFCLSAHATKSRRQLLEIANQDIEADDSVSFKLQRIIRAHNEEKMNLDKKVKDFIFSLDALKKSRQRAFQEHFD